MSQQTYPIKMYESKMFKNIPMFKRPDISSHNDGQWNGFMETQYDVEVRSDNKARVFSNNPFNHKPSRFCKLKLVQVLSNTNMRVYQLTVNGQQAFFKIAYIIK